MVSHDSTGVSGANKRNGREELSEMAYGASVTGELVGVMSDIYRGAKGLVEVDGGITMEERALADRLMLAMELAIRADQSTLDLNALARGRYDTPWCERRHRDTERDILRMREEHTIWVNSLETGGRLYVPFGRSRVA